MGRQMCSTGIPTHGGIRVRRQPTLEPVPGWALPACHQIRQEGEARSIRAAASGARRARSPALSGLRSSRSKTRDVGMAGRRGVGERDHLPRPSQSDFAETRTRPGLRRHRVCRGHLAARRRRVGRRGVLEEQLGRQDRGDFEFQKLELRAFPKDNGSNGLTLFADLRTYTPGGNRVTQGHEDTVRARFWAMDHERQSAFADGLLSGRPERPQAGGCAWRIQSVEVERCRRATSSAANPGIRWDGRRTLSLWASDVNGSRAWPADVASANETQSAVPLPSDLAEI